MLTSLIFAAILLAADDKDAKELAKLQGDWETQSSEIDGGVVPAGRPAVWTFKGNEYVTTKPDGSKSSKVAFKIDTSKQPMHFDATTASGKVVPCICKLEGDKLTICFSKGESRPTEFKTARGSETMTVIYKRVKK